MKSTLLILPLALMLGFSSCEKTENTNPDQPVTPPVALPDPVPAPILVDRTKILVNFSPDTTTNVHRYDAQFRYTGMDQLVRNVPNGYSTSWQHQGNTATRLISSYNRMQGLSSSSQMWDTITFNNDGTIARATIYHLVVDTNNTSITRRSLGRRMTFKTIPPCRR